MGFEVFLLDETHVVGRHQRRADLVGQGHRGVQLLFVVGAVGTLHFQVEALGEYGHPLPGQGLGNLEIAGDQGHADLALLGRREHDQAFRGLRHPLTLDDDLAVALAIDEAAGNQLGQVAVTHGVHHQQADAAQGVIRVLVRQPQVGAADRLDPRPHAGFIELDQGTHVVLVGDRHRRHAHAGQRLDQRLDPHQTVDQGIFSVQAQVNE